MYRISKHSNNIQEIKTGNIFRQDDSNSSYINYLSWLKEENSPEIVDLFESEQDEFNRIFIPKVVSQRQLRTQLLLDGFDLNDVQLAINELTEPNKSIAQIAWDYAITFERDSPLLMCLASNLGLTQNEVDTIFLNASKL